MGLAEATKFGGGLKLGLLESDVEGFTVVGRDDGFDDSDSSTTLGSPRTCN